MRGLGMLLTVALGLAGCADGGKTEPDARSRTSPTTSPASTRAIGPRTDDGVAAAFVQAWSKGDVAAMRAVADEAAVVTALRFDGPTGPTGCTTQPDGQHQCIVDVAGETRLYVLVGEPGAVEGRAWWVAVYVPGS